MLTLLQCPHCEYASTNQDNLRRHVKGRHPQALFACKNRGCTRKFEFAWKRERHERLCKFAPKEPVVRDHAISRRPRGRAKQRRRSVSSSAFTVQELEESAVFEAIRSEESDFSTLLSGTPSDDDYVFLHFGHFAAFLDERKVVFERGPGFSMGLHLEGHFSVDLSGIVLGGQVFIRQENCEILRIKNVKAVKRSGAIFLLEIHALGCFLTEDEDPGEARYSELYTAYAPSDLTDDPVARIQHFQITLTDRSVSILIVPKSKTKGRQQDPANRDTSYLKSVLWGQCLQIKGVGTHRLCRDQLTVIAEAGIYRPTGAVAPLLTDRDLYCVNDRLVRYNAESNTLACVREERFDSPQLFAPPSSNKNKVHGATYCCGERIAIWNADQRRHGCLHHLTHSTAQRCPVCSR